MIVEIEFFEMLLWPATTPEPGTQILSCLLPGPRVSLAVWYIYGSVLNIIEQQVTVACVSTASREARLGATRRHGSTLKLNFTHRRNAL